jgi:hypothetical protein
VVALQLAGCGGGADDEPDCWRDIAPSAELSMQGTFWSGLVPASEYADVVGQVVYEGMTIDWSNSAGGSGRTVSTAETCVCPCFGRPLEYVCGYRWSASVPLAVGHNVITFVSSYGGCSAEQSIAIERS